MDDEQIGGAPAPGLSRKDRLLYAMKHNLSPDAAELDAQWREAFGAPMPIFGADDELRRVLSGQIASARPKPPRRRAGAARSTNALGSNGTIL